MRLNRKWKAYDHLFSLLPCLDAICCGKHVSRDLPCIPQPAFVFAGHQFDSDAQLRLCKSMLLDLFRGRIVENINLKVGALFCLL